MECSIYYIKCNVTNKYYIGSCLNFNARIKNHFDDLAKGKHKNKLLQADYNYYGKSSFEYGKLDECDEEIALEKENQWMDVYKSYILEYGTTFGYNLARASRKKSSFINNNTENYSKALKGNKNSRKLTNEQCKEIKKLLLEDTTEMVKDKLERISKLYNVSSATIGSIRNGTSAYSEFLNGCIYDWLKEKE